MTDLWNNRGGGVVRTGSLCAAHCSGMSYVAYWITGILSKHIALRYNFFIQSL